MACCTQLLRVCRSQNIHWRSGRTRFGGQVNDTLWASRTTSGARTDGPVSLPAALEAHTRTYDVDIANLQRAEKIIPRANPAA